jgi:hypothetical protein
MQQEQHEQKQEEQPQQSLDKKETNWKGAEITPSVSSTEQVKAESDWQTVAKETQQQVEEKLVAARVVERQAQEVEEQHSSYATSSGKERAAALRLEAEQLRLQAERARL